MNKITSVARQIRTNDTILFRNTLHDVVQMEWDKTLDLVYVTLDQWSDGTETRFVFDGSEHVTFIRP